MIVPQFWAEARLQQREGNRQVTVRRFGWSDLSQPQAQMHAEERARDAMLRIQSGEPLKRREPKVAYNGAEGVPIREEVVDRFGDDIVITCNSYGALCLNAAQVLFADLDFERDAPERWTATVMLGGMFAGFLVGMGTQSWRVGAALAIVAVVFGYPFAVASFRCWLALAGGPEHRAHARVADFSRANLDWHLRVYRTPAGLRVLVMHRTFDPAEVDAARCFHALKADPVYCRMCLRQRCFRARLSAKPWRIGIAAHLRPRPGVWPVAAASLPERQRWLNDYDRAAQRFAACRFVKSLGSSTVHPEALRVQRVHDELCRAGSQLAIA